MDDITRSMLEKLAGDNPRASIRLTHQFLDGEEGRPCGYVPHDWDGRVVSVVGKWFSN